LPGARSKSAYFDVAVDSALVRLERAWASHLRRIEVTVEDVPSGDPASWEDGMVPLAHSFGRHGGQPARIALYRRPIEARAADRHDLAILVLDVLVEHIAHLLGRPPEDIDPGYGG
jgi:predicted Zn-dependent protease with MMP-like domain